MTHELGWFQPSSRVKCASISRTKHFNHPDMALNPLMPSLAVSPCCIATCTFFRLGILLYFLGTCNEGLVPTSWPDVLGVVLPAAHSVRLCPHFVAPNQLQWTSSSRRVRWGRAPKAGFKTLLGLLVELQVHRFGSESRSGAEISTPFAHRADPAEPGSDMARDCHGRDAACPRACDLRPAPVCAPTCRRLFLRSPSTSGTESRVQHTILLQLHVGPAVWSPSRLALLMALPQPSVQSARFVHQRAPW